MRALVAVLLCASLLSITPVSAAELGVATPALSYCAHWFARDGNACVTSAQAGQLVVPDANNPSQVNAAMNHCKQAGCKVALYCECGYRGVGVAQVAQLFANVVRQHGTGTIVNQVEVDHIADISAAQRTAVLQELGRHGFAVILKNYAGVEAASAILPVSRVVYEDIVNDGNYRADMLRLAQQRPNLLITAIVHQGAYGGDSGATPEQANAVFAQFKDFKNVELFYGMPTSFRKVKSFDGAMESLARELGRGFPIAAPGPGSLLGPFSGPDNRLLGNVRQMLQPSSPFSAIAPPSGPLPSYLNPLQQNPTHAAQPIVVPATSSAASNLLEALSQPASGGQSRTAISLVSGTERGLTVVRSNPTSSPVTAPQGTTTVTMFPLFAPEQPTGAASEDLLSRLAALMRSAVERLTTLVRTATR